MTTRGVTFASSPAYGQTVALGPVQRDLLELLLQLTAGGRRPELTLGELAARLGRAVSSIHEAIGRLRALGLIGVAARMGRRGGHRIWRVRPVVRKLDQDRHRWAIARIVGRYGKGYAARAVGDPRRHTPTDAPDPSPGAGASVNHKTLDEGRGRLHGNPDPFSVGRPDAAPRHGGRGAAPRRPGETFGAKLRRYGLGSWIDERPHEGPPSDI